MPGRMCDGVLKVRSYLSFVKDKHTLGKKKEPEMVVQSTL